jgi:hypothetical protein
MHGAMVGGEFLQAGEKTLLVFRNGLDIVARGENLLQGL